MKDQPLYKAASFAAWLALAALLVMGFGVRPPDPQIPFQPGPVSQADFLKAIDMAPRQVLGFFAGDSLFVLSYMVVFVGLHRITSRNVPSLAALGLGAGVATALLDATENAHYIVYARWSLAGVVPIEPALPFLFILANVKWMASFLTLFCFGLSFPRDTRLHKAVSLLMLAVPLLGVVSVLLPQLMLGIGLLFLIGMPLFAITFRGYGRYVT